jgi:hypothetical protein
MEAYFWLALSLFAARSLSFVALTKHLLLFHCPLEIIKDPVYTNLLGRTFLLGIPQFVTPSNQLAYSSDSNLPTRQHHQQLQNASKHCHLCAAGWASSGRTHPSPEHSYHDQTHRNRHRSSNLDRLRLLSRRKHNSSPFRAVWNGIGRLWGCYDCTRPQPDQRHARRATCQA